MEADADRLHGAVYAALRLIEDTDLTRADLARATGLADELLGELNRIEGELGG